MIALYPRSTAAPKARFAHASLLDSKSEFVKAFDSYQKFIINYRNDSFYLRALARQATVAHAAARGKIGTSFLGIRSSFDPKKITGMLQKVRDNAPAAPSAPKAQFAIGQVWEKKNSSKKAVAAYKYLASNYPESSLAPEAQYRIGHILLRAARKGNHDQANLDSARRAFEELILSYPSSRQASKARVDLSGIARRDLQRSYDIAEFYRKKGQAKPAAFYYREVLRNATPKSDFHRKASRRLQMLGSR